MVIFKKGLLNRRFQDLIPLVFFSAVGAYTLWPFLPFLSTPAPPRTLVVYGFSILGDVMENGVLPAFQESWRRETGEEVEIISAFAGSGTITNQVIMGVPADIVILSLELDAYRLSSAGVVTPGSWRQLPHEGIVNRTPLIILTRPGNPLKIQDFQDLARPGLGVVHPDPLTSGAANWAILAEYGAGARSRPDDPQAGAALLSGIWGNVIAQASSARGARTQFENGFGDALITYEQEVLLDRSRGRLAGEIIYPRRTILSEHTVVVVDRNIQPDELDLVTGLVDFLWSAEAQTLFVAYGYRSVDESLNGQNPEFGTIEDPFTIGDFGGWVRAGAEIIEAVWKRQVIDGGGS